MTALRNLPNTMSDAGAEDWVAANWGWTEPSDDDRRCLWVLQQFLSESNHRLYHLPRGLKPRRVGDGFQVVIAEEYACTWDFPGLSALVVAAHVAHVRASLGVEEIHAVYNRSEWETVEQSWDPIPEDPNAVEHAHETRTTMVLSLHPRKVVGGVIERHPGVERLTDLIDSLT